MQGDCTHDVDKPKLRNDFKIWMQWAPIVVLNKYFIKLLANSEMNQLCALTHALRRRQPLHNHQKVRQHGKATPLTTYPVGTEPSQKGRGQGCQLSTCPMALSGTVVAPTLAEQ